MDCRSHCFSPLFKVYLKAFFKSCWCISQVALWFSLNARFHLVTTKALLGGQEALQRERRNPTTCPCGRTAAVGLGWMDSGTDVTKVQAGKTHWMGNILSCEHPPCWSKVGSHDAELFVAHKQLQISLAEKAWHVPLAHQSLYLQSGSQQQPLSDCTASCFSCVLCKLRFHKPSFAKRSEREVHLV